MRIDILGAGCPKCRETERVVREALQSLGVAAEVGHVTDPREIAARRVMFTPAVAIDGVVVLAGRVPTVDQARQAIRQHAGG